MGVVWLTFMAPMAGVTETSRGGKSVVVTLLTYGTSRALPARSFAAVDTPTVYVVSCWAKEFWHTALCGSGHCHVQVTPGTTATAAAKLAWSMASLNLSSSDRRWVAGFTQGERPTTSGRDTSATAAMANATAVELEGGYQA